MAVPRGISGPVFLPRPLFLPLLPQKRALEKVGSVAEHVCAEMPHRQFVPQGGTIPKRLRIYFRFVRRLLGQLCRAAARTVITVYRAVSGRPDAVPGMVGAIQIPLCGTSSSMPIRTSTR